MITLDVHSSSVSYSICSSPLPSSLFPLSLPLCCPADFPLFFLRRRPLIPLSLRGRFPRRRPRGPVADPRAELSDALSERREDGALLQEGVRRRPAPRHRRRYVSTNREPDLGPRPAGSVVCGGGLCVSCPRERAVSLAL